MCLSCIREYSWLCRVSLVAWRDFSSAIDDPRRSCSDRRPSPEGAGQSRAYRPDGSHGLWSSLEKWEVGYPRNVTSSSTSWRRSRHLRASTRQVWRHRWTSLLVCSANKVFVLSLLTLKNAIRLRLSLRWSVIIGTCLFQTEIGQVLSASFNFFWIILDFLWSFQDFRRKKWI